MTRKTKKQPKVVKSKKELEIENEALHSERIGLYSRMDKLEDEIANNDKRVEHLIFQKNALGSNLEDLKKSNKSYEDFIDLIANCLGICSDDLFKKNRTILFELGKLVAIKEQNSWETRSAIKSWLDQRIAHKKLKKLVIAGLLGSIFGSIYVILKNGF